MAAYYREPRITAVLRFLSIGFVISGCSVLQKAIFERNLAFRITAWSETAGVVGGAVVGIASALMGAGIWALVAQALVSASVTSALLWAFSDWRPTLTFEWAEIKRVSGFSLGLTGFNFVNYFARNADYLLIGRFLGANQLGIYTLAYRVMLYPLQSVSAVVSRVTFPVCTQFQDDDARFRSAYLRTAAMIGLVTFPIVLGVYSVARPLVSYDLRVEVDFGDTAHCHFDSYRPDPIDYEHCWNYLSGQRTGQNIFRLGHRIKLTDCHGIRRGIALGSAGRRRSLCCRHVDHHNPVFRYPISFYRPQTKIFYRGSRPPVSEQHADDGSHFCVADWIATFRAKRSSLGHDPRRCCFIYCLQLDCEP